MLLEVKLKLTSEMLGCDRRPDGVRRFIRTPNGNIKIGIEHWDWAFREAASSLRREIDTGCLHPNEGIPCPSLCLYQRQFPDKKKPTHVRKEPFEAVSRNCVLTFKIALTEPRDPARVPPTVGDVIDMFGFIGEFLGISQWGNQFGFGRFTVIAVTAL